MFEEQIDAFMPPSRRGSQNRFCQTVQSLAANENFLQASTVRHLVAAQGGRYFKVNLQPLLSQGSLEFRQHSGTLNSAKIHNWLNFLDGFMRESCRRADLEEGVPAVPAQQPENPLPRLQPRLEAIVNLLAAHPEGLSSDFLQGALNLQRHSLRANWDRLITFFKFQEAIRKVIYTTNAIESLNMSLRKIIKNRGSFPNYEAAFKLIWLALNRISKKWTQPIRDWKAALNCFAILYEDRVSLDK